MAATYPNVDAANRWAKAVIAGKIPACKWVKLACQRHLDDLKNQKNVIFLINLSLDLLKKDTFCRTITSHKR
ncbi:hypothetical protein MKR65_17235 [Acinetobacter baumannii]